VKFHTGGKVHKPIYWWIRCDSETDSTVWKGVS